MLLLAFQNYVSVMNDQEDFWHGVAVQLLCCVYMIIVRPIRTLATAAE